MLFNSYPFLCAFLPVTLLVVFGLSGLGQRQAAKGALFLASIGFYAYWSTTYTLLLLGIVAFNLIIGRTLLALNAKEAPEKTRLAVLVFGLTLNIGALIYYKYTNFFLDTLGDITGTRLAFGKVILPLGISFITFQKIAFLVDVYTGAVTSFATVDYCLFVTFFPQLIAGPIVHHAEVIPQFAHEETLHARASYLTAGLGMLVIGLGKKVIIADAIAPYANAIYAVAASGKPQDLFASWSGAISYTLQLYFDFSGYCDMAIGLALLFGIHLPFNFDSPLKATNIIDYWRRWHMTLTRFLTGYLYNPIVLRLTRRRMAQGKSVITRRNLDAGAFTLLLAFPTVLTMTVAGVWHGAGWQFLVFGVLHGLFLAVNHAFRAFGQKKPKGDKKAKKEAEAPPSKLYVAACWALTFVCGLVGHVFFRADSVTTALRLLKGMVGANGVALPELYRSRFGALSHLGIGFQGGPSGGVAHLTQVAITFGALAAVLALPNSQQIMGDVLAKLKELWPDLSPHLREQGSTTPSWVKLLFRPSVAWAVGFSVLAFWALIRLSAVSSEFLYFNF